jgi:N-acetylmuramoyl-L-alanine amidase
MKWYISPSSQEANRYAGGGTTEEAAMNLIANILCCELDRHDIPYKRNNPANGANGHVADSNAWGAQAHLAIHTNARGAGATAKVRGCEVYCFDPDKPDKLGTIIAKAVYDEISTLTPTADRGIKSGATTMSEIKHTNAAAVLVEIDYHDDADGAAWIVANIARIAHSLLRAILAVERLSYIPAGQNSSSEANKAVVEALEKKVASLTDIISQIHKLSALS